MATDVPLLSGYKRNFVLRRFLHTATGLKLFPGQTPAYSWFLRHSSELRAEDNKYKVDIFLQAGYLGDAANHQSRILFPQHQTLLPRLAGWRRGGLRILCGRADLLWLETISQ